MLPEQIFWIWFVEHEPRLFSLDAGPAAQREGLLDELAAQLQKVHRDLTFELGSSGPKRELVVSAGGLREAFPAVISLLQAAPPLKRWKLTAFRPRRSPSVIELGGKRVDPECVRFTLLDNSHMAGIYLFIPGFDENDPDFKQAGYLLLDEALGEYDVESRLGLVKMLPPEVRTSGERHPIAALPKLFDQLVSRLEGRSGKPS